MEEQLFLVWSALGTIIRVLRTREMKVKSEKAISFKNLTQDASVHILALGPLWWGADPLHYREALQHEAATHCGIQSSAHTQCPGEDLWAPVRLIGAGKCYGSEWGQETMERDISRSGWTSVLTPRLSQRQMCWLSSACCSRSSLHPFCPVLQTWIMSYSRGIPVPLAFVWVQPTGCTGRSAPKSHHDWLPPPPPPPSKVTTPSRDPLHTAFCLQDLFIGPILGCFRPAYMCAKPLQSCLTLWDTMDCSLPGSSVHEIFPGRNTGVDCHALLQGIIPIQGSSPCHLHLLHCRLILYHFLGPKEGYTTAICSPPRLLHRRWIFYILFTSL